MHTDFKLFKVKVPFIFSARWVFATQGLTLRYNCKLSVPAALQNGVALYEKEYKIREPV